MKTTRAKTKFGSIYKKYNKGPGGTRVEVATWTVRYKGRDYATGETDVKKAEKFLLKLAGDIAHGKAPEKKPESVVTVTMNELFDIRDANARRKGIANARPDEGRMKLHLRPFFGAMDATKLTSADIEKYTDLRLDQEAAPATINRELANLKRALNLAIKRDPPLITRRPAIEMLPVLNAREGFLDHPEYIKLRGALPDYLEPIFVAGYHVGNRRGELLQVELKDIELDAPQPQFRLYADATKTKKPRIVPIIGDMVEVFRRQIKIARAIDCPWLFHIDGKQIFTFYKAWKTATSAVGLDGLLFHDLRRTAVRNLIRAGVDRTVAMKITGHKTESVFARYNITSDKDLSDAAAKVVAYHAALSAAPVIPTSTLVS